MDLFGRFLRRDPAAIPNPDRGRQVALVFECSSSIDLAQSPGPLGAEACDLLIQLHQVIFELAIVDPSEILACQLIDYRTQRTHRVNPYLKPDYVVPPTCDIARPLIRALDPAGETHELKRQAPTPEHGLPMTGSPYQMDETQRFRGATLPC